MLEMTNMIAKARGRLDEMIERGTKVLATRHSGNMGPDYLGDQPGYDEWRVSAKTVVRALNAGGHHEKEFETADTRSISMGFGYADRLERQLAVLRSFREDFDGGFLSDIQNAVRAEVFADFMEQAEYLFDQGFWQPVPVIVGAVLEDHLRKLCAKYSITLPKNPKLDGMNADLAKAGEYGKLEQKQITVWADVRNKAAHGEWGAYKKEQVEAMLRDVPPFLVAHKLP